MDDKLKFAGMLLGGYLLGRTKRMKTALMLATTVGAKQLQSNPEMLAKAGSAVLSSPEVKKLTDELTGRLTEAAKAAAVAAATKRVESLTTNIQARTEKLADLQETTEKLQETTEKLH